MNKVADKVTDKVVRIALLFDFYGQLLTERQRKSIALYYENDLSLKEIAEIFGVSRQAVYDSIKRAEKLLHDYEEKLGLVHRFLRQRKKLVEALKLLDSFCLQGTGNVGQVVQVQRILREVLELF